MHVLSQFAGASGEGLHKVRPQIIKKEIVTYLWAVSIPATSYETAYIINIQIDTDQLSFSAG